MMLIGILCLSTFLQLSCVQGEAKLGVKVVEHTNVKSRRTTSSGSKSGRPVTIPTENIISMAGVPFSTLSTSNATVKQIIIDTHNDIRRNVNPPAKNMLKMIWNDEATKTAERWAKTCSLIHSPIDVRNITNFNCGENLFMSTFKAHWKDVIQSFHSEYVDFVYGKGAKAKGLETGHYTQVVWYNSYQAGCAVAECPDAEFQYFYVCHYCPPGNNAKSITRPYETGTPCGACPNSCDKGLCTNHCKYQDFYANCNTYKSTCNSDKTLQGDCGSTCFCNNNEIK